MHVVPWSDLPGSREGPHEHLPCVFRHDASAPGILVSSASAGTSSPIIQVLASRHSTACVEPSWESSRPISCKGLGKGEHIDESPNDSQFHSVRGSRAGRHGKSRCSRVRARCNRYAVSDCTSQAEQQSNNSGLWKILRECAVHSAVSDQILSQSPCWPTPAYTALVFRL